MKLDRNTTEGGEGKYALVKLRRVRELRADVERQRQKPLPDHLRHNLIDNALRDLAEFDVLDDSGVGDEGEFFVIRLRDKYARAALLSYAFAANVDDPEYADEIVALAARAGPNSPFVKRPD